MSGLLRNEGPEGISLICQLCHSPFKAEWHIHMTKGMTNDCVWKGYQQPRRMKGMMGVHHGMEIKVSVKTVSDSEMFM